MADNDIKSIEHNGMEIKVNGFTRTKQRKTSIVEPKPGKNPIASANHPYIDFQTEQHVQDHLKDGASYLFCIVRSKNYNVVIFEYIKKWDEENCKSCPVDAYFLLLDRQWLEQRYMENDNVHQTYHREELSFYEKRVYGVSKPVIDNNREKKTLTSSEFVLPFLKDRKISLSWDKINSTTYAEIVISGQKSKLKKIYIETMERFTGLPKVGMVYLYGTSTIDGAEIEECITI